MKLDFKIKEVRPKVFLFEFKDTYDMCMHFLRYQEYYESASSKYRGHKFTIFDFMRWYSKTYGHGAFTYCTDWDGFNIPGSVIREIATRGILDYNKYDRAMWEGYCHGVNKAGNKIYIIGAVKGSNALKHEVAHAFFYLHPKYKKEMTKLVKALPATIADKMKHHLKRVGYTPKVYVDEMQAYLSTGLTELFGHDTTKWKTEREPFEKAFNEFYGESK